MPLGWIESPRDFPQANPHPTASGLPSENPLGLQSSPRAFPQIVPLYLEIHHTRYQLKYCNDCLFVLKCYVTLLQDESMGRIEHEETIPCHVFAER